MARKASAQARPKQPALPLTQRLRAWLPRAFEAVAVFAVASAAVWGVNWLRNPHNMPLRSVQIEGEFRKLSSDQLQAAIAKTVQGGFFSVDVDQVRRAAETLPWVESASVRRVWPDTLRLQVVEQRAAARWGEKGLLNLQGFLFEPAADSIPDHLPRLSGPADLRRRVMEHYIAMTEALGPIGRRVDSLHLDDRRAWSLRLDNGVEVKLGRDQTLPRLERFVRVYPNVFVQREAELKAVDMRYSNGFAVRWDQSQPTTGERREG